MNFFLAISKYLYELLLTSVLATVFAAIPVMAPYTVSVVGVIELFFVRGETAAAIVFFLLSAAPLCFADPAFYRELKSVLSFFYCISKVRFYLFKCYSFLFGLEKIYCCRGSHPYVTGLSIVGGIYWLGLQGAIFGPMMLCSMLVLFNVYAKFTKRA